MLVYKDGDRLMYGPDWVRMRKRFEVFNSNVEITKLGYHARNMSYLYILGKIKPVEDCCK